MERIWDKILFISDHNTEIRLPIQRMCLKDRFLLLEGEGYRKWVDAFECSFDEKYAITITPFHTLQRADKLRIGFKAYE